MKPFVYAAVDEDDFDNRSRANVRVRLSTLDASGDPLTGVEVRAIDLIQNENLRETFDPGDGRREVTVPRKYMRDVQGGRYRRFTLRISWDGGALNRVLVVSEQGG